MGSSFGARLTAAIALLLAAGILVHSRPEPLSAGKAYPLAAAIARIGGGWKPVRTVPLEKRVVEALHLDDYVFQEFTRDGKTVSLYIGYYFTTRKVGAAHDPLVCFPGQGWIISDRGKGSVKPRTGEAPIRYAALTVERDRERIYLVYWFQAFDVTADNTFRQKILSFSRKLRGGNEDNAFVRISCIIKDDETACREAVLDFAKAFYPVFLDYVRSGTR